MEKRLYTIALDDTCGVVAHTDEDGVTFLKFYNPKGMRALAIETSIAEYRTLCLEYRSTLDR